VVTDPCKIAVNYVKSWFAVDVIAAVPFDLLLISTGSRDVRIYDQCLPVITVDERIVIHSCSRF